MPLSDYQSALIVESAFNDGGAMPTLGSVWLALFSTATTNSGGGTELTGSNYARTEIVLPGFTTTTRGLENTADIVTVAASADWLAATHGALYDASVAGNPLCHGALTASITVLQDQRARFVAGALTFDFDVT